MILGHYTYTLYIISGRDDRNIYNNNVLHCGSCVFVFNTYKGIVHKANPEYSTQATTAGGSTRLQNDG